MLHPRFLHRRAGGRARRRSPPAGERNEENGSGRKYRKETNLLPAFRSARAAPPILPLFALLRGDRYNTPFVPTPPPPANNRPTTCPSAPPRRPLGRRHPPLRLDTTARVRLLFVRSAAAAGPFLVQFWGEGGETRTSFLPLQFTFWGALKGRKTSPLFFVDDAYFLTPLPFPPVSSPLIHHRPCFRCCGVFCRI